MVNIIEITDFSAPELDTYARLNEREIMSRDKPEKGIFIAESPNVIERALDFGCVPVSILTVRKHIEGQAKDIIARCGDIPVYTSTLDVLTQLTGFALTRGILCAMRRPPLLLPEDICEGAKRIAVLEDIMNPTNLGAIFRSAAALGIDAVLLTPGCCDPLYRRCVRVSMGTVFQVPWAHLGSDTALWPQAGMQRIKNMGFKTAAMALSETAVSITDSALQNEQKLAIILGTEGDGLSPATITDCDYTVKIPM
ncbi:MAG: RNA methyltransferase, partial [Clostridia bacterium]|nr:RNA methyltransferase [Clostridia bacterium]